MWDRLSSVGDALEEHAQFCCGGSEILNGVHKRLWCLGNANDEMMMFRRMGAWDIRGNYSISLGGLELAAT
jgi:hypothetical protein